MCPQQHKRAQRLQSLQLCPGQVVQCRFSASVWKSANVTRRGQARLQRNSSEGAGRGGMGRSMRGPSTRATLWTLSCHDAWWQASSTLAVFFRVLEDYEFCVTDSLRNRTRRLSDVWSTWLVCLCWIRPCLITTEGRLASLSGPREYALVPKGAPMSESGWKIPENLCHVLEVLLGSAYWKLQKLLTLCLKQSINQM